MDLQYDTFSPLLDLKQTITPVMGKIAPLPCGSLRKAKARGVNLKQNKEWSPSGGASDRLDAVPATPAGSQPGANCSVLHSFGAHYTPTQWGHYYHWMFRNPTWSVGNIG